MKVTTKNLLIICLVIGGIWIYITTPSLYERKKEPYKTINNSNANTTLNSISNTLHLEVKGSLPKTFSSGAYYYNYVTIESVKYKLENEGYRKVIKTYWSGTAGSSYKGSNYSINRKVGYKLYDPTGLVIKSGTFRTESSLKENEIFKDDPEKMYFYEDDFNKLNQSGIYILELMDTD